MIVPLAIISFMVATTTEILPLAPAAAAIAPASPPGNRFIRIRAWEGGWALPGYNAQQVLAMILDLRPNVLERYISGGFNPNATVPVANGEPQMTIVQFLNASLQACAAESCYIIPRISLADYNSGKLYNESLQFLNLPVYPRITFLSLDDWSQFATTHTQSQIQSMFQTLYAQGWQGIGVNDAGGYYSAYGYASFADFGIITNSSTNPWTPNLKALQQLKNDTSIKRELLYIDFPDQMTSFNASLTPDQEANVLSYNITSIQSKNDFTFVYPIIQGFWDSTEHITSLNSTWAGASIYDVENDLMDEYNPPLMTTESTSSTTAPSSSMSSLSSSSNSSTSTTSEVSTSTSSSSVSTSTTSSVSIATSSSTPSITKSSVESSSTQSSFTSISSRTSTQSTAPITSNVSTSDSQTSFLTSIAPVSLSSNESTLTSSASYVTSTVIYTTSSSATFLRTSVVSSSTTLSTISALDGVANTHKQADSDANSSTTGSSILALTAQNNSTSGSVEVATIYAFSTFLAVLSLGGPMIVTFFRRTR